MADIPHQDLQNKLSAAVETMNRDGELSFKAMFGGACAYVQGRVFGSLSDVGLALKLAPDAQSELLQAPDAKRLRYEPDAPESKTYIVVPPVVADDARLLAAWAARSMDFALAQPAPKAKKSAVKQKAL